ncbi:MAG: CapA family protein [Candidatus Limnocylindrales bacterium]
MPDTRIRRASRLPALLLVVSVVACTSTSTPATTAPAPSTSQGASAAPASPGASPSATPTASQAVTSVPLALVADVRDKRDGLTIPATRAAIAGGALVPCGLTDLRLAGQALAAPSQTCLSADKITALVHGHAGVIGLLPPGLVSARVKVLRVGGADLFGPPSVRKLAYPLAAAAHDLPAAWTAYDVADIRTVDSTGDTCPDRGPAKAAIVQGRGWPWILNGGSARYTGLHMDTAFSGPTGNGWPVVEAVRRGDTGKVRALISDADITVNDFECPMLAKFVYHSHGTVFNIDPKVAPLIAGAGIDVVTLGSNHITDAGTSGVKQTLAYLDANKVKHTGAGLNLAQALAPAVIDVRGVRFAFVGWDDIAGSAAASATRAGAATLSDANVKASLAAARQQADVVFAMPQWGWPEYHAGFTKQQLAQRTLFFTAGADHVLGSGTHWAAAVSITPDAAGAEHFVISSHGNFLFGQDWSRQTMEGVVVELTFSGTHLVQARLHPYIVLDQAQPNLVEPTTDGAYVLDQVWKVSQLP